MDRAPAEWIRKERARNDHLIAVMKVQPCAICGESGPRGRSVHHVIPLTYWGETVWSNLMPVCMRRVNGCVGHFALNHISYKWCRAHEGLYRGLSMDDLARLCKEFIFLEVRRINAFSVGAQTQNLGGGSGPEGCCADSEEVGAN